MPPFDAFAHYLAYGATDQQTFIELRESWLAVAQSNDIKVKLQALQAFDKVLDEHIELRRLCIKFIRQAATTINPIITERSRQGSNHAFWNSLGRPDDGRQPTRQRRDASRSVRVELKARSSFGAPVRCGRDPAGNGGSARLSVRIGTAGPGRGGRP